MSLRTSGGGETALVVPVHLPDRRCQINGCRVLGLFKTAEKWTNRRKWRDNCTHGTAIGICSFPLQSSRAWAANRARPGASSPSLSTPTVLAPQFSKKNPHRHPDVPLHHRPGPRQGCLQGIHCARVIPGEKNAASFKKMDKKSQQCCWCHACCRT